MANKDKKIWSEIRNEYTESDTGITKIDAWVTEDDDENGKTIAEIDLEGKVKYKDRRAKTNKYAQELIQQVVEERENRKQKLVDEVIEQLKRDIQMGDDTILDELLKRLPSKTLLHSLPEEKWDDFQEILF